MNVEELLALTAHRVASDVTPPPAPDPTRLGARAVSLRRRRRVGAASSATVAAVEAAILLPAFGDRRSDPEPVEPPPPPRLGNVPAWVDLDGDIHVGEHELDLPEPNDSAPDCRVPDVRQATTRRRFGRLARPRI